MPKRSVFGKLCQHEHDRRNEKCEHTTRKKKCEDFSSCIMFVLLFEGKKKVRFTTIYACAYVDSLKSISHRENVAVTHGYPCFLKHYCVLRHWRCLCKAIRSWWYGVDRVWQRNDLLLLRRSRILPSIPSVVPHVSPRSKLSMPQQGPLIDRLV